MRQESGRPPNAAAVQTRGTSGCSMIIISIGKEVYGLFSTYSSTSGGAKCFTMTLTSTHKTRPCAWKGRVQKLRRSQTHADMETKIQRENDAYTQNGQIHTNTDHTHTCRRTQKRAASAKSNHTLSTTTSSRKGVMQY